MTPLFLTLAAMAAGPDYWAFRAEQFASQQEWTAAIDNADEAVRLDHENPRRYLDRAYIKLKARRYAEALGDANRAELRYRRFGLQTMAPPYLSGEIHRLSAMNAANLNEANVVLGLVEFELNRIEEELGAPAPPGIAPEEQAAQIALLTGRLKEIDEQREQARIWRERLADSSSSLEQAKESYSIAVGRLPASPHPLAGRKLAEEALRLNSEVLEKADQVSEKADALYENAATRLQGLSKTTPST